MSAEGRLVGARPDDNRSVSTEPRPAPQQPPVPPSAWPQGPAHPLPPLPEPLPRPEHTPLLAWPARLAVLVVVLPARAAWEALGAVLRALEWLWERLVMRPLAALGRLLFRYLVAPLGRALMVPLRALWRWALKPALVAVGVAVSFLCTYLLVVPLTWLWQQLLRPVGRILLVALRPLGRALVWAWHAAGRVLAVLWRWLSAPFRWAYRAVLTPVGHAVRSAWRAVAVPVGRAVAEVSAEVGRVFGRR